MIVSVRGEALVLMDLPNDFTLPERYPVSWNADLRAFSIPRRHPSVSSLLQLLVEAGHLDAVPAGVGRRAPARTERRGPRHPSRPPLRVAA